MKKNLVMAAAKGYGFFELEPFLMSFKKNCSSADLVLFVDEISDFTKKQIQTCIEDVQLVQIPEDLKDKLIIDLRWNLYKNFLEKHSEYEKILVTDIADVIFQSDIFEKYSAQKKFLSVAVESITVENDPGGFNQQYVSHFCGEDEYKKLKNKSVICCGTVCGTREEIQLVFEKMVELLERSTQWGDEQAAMIYLVHNKLLPIKNLIKSDVKTGEILTVSILQDYQIQDNKILRGDGKAPALVHQYNRKPELIYFVDSIHREKNFDLQENFSDFDSLFDEMFCLVNARKWSDATKIFVNNLLYDAKLKSCGKKLSKLHELIFSCSEVQNFDAEILIAAVQTALTSAFSENLELEQIDNFLRYFDFSRQNFHTVTSTFENFLANSIQYFVDVLYKSGDKVACLNYLEHVERFNLPLSESFYLTLAKIYREVGEKEKALSAYKKALERNGED